MAEYCRPIAYLEQYAISSVQAKKKITSKQAERLRKWLTSMSTNHLLIQRTKPAQANIGIYVGNAKSFAELPEELVTTKIRKLQRAVKPIISLTASS